MQPPIGDRSASVEAPEPRPGAHPFGYGYEPPGIGRGRPAVIMWFRVYSATALMLYVGLFALWEVFIWDVAAASHHSPNSQLGTLIIVGAIGLALGAIFTMGVFVPYKPWGWTLGLIVICLGLPTILMIASIPLLIGWMKPTTKAAFQRL